MRSRSENETQKWFCQKCKAITVHEAVPGSRPRRLGSGYFGYRREHRCQSCKSPASTAQLSATELQILIVQHKKLSKTNAELENELRRFRDMKAAIASELERAP